MAFEVDLPGVVPFVRDACLAMGWSQRELSRRSGVPQTSISRFLRGRLDAIDLDQLSKLMGAIGGRLRVSIDAPFLADRSRQRDRVHARCIAYVAGRLRRAGWLVAMEVEIDGRAGSGWIDVLAIEPRTGTLLVIEIKTELVDFGRVQRTLAWYERGAWAAARRLGWSPRSSVAALLILATTAADRRVRENGDLVRVAFAGSVGDLRSLVSQPRPAQSLAPTIAMIDPLSRASVWLRASVAAGRRSPAPYADYAGAARRLDERRHGSG